MSAPKRMLLKHLRYNSWLHSFLSPWVHIYISSENPFREMGAFQNGSAWTRSDTDAAHMRKASGVIQVRQTRQMQVNKDACIRNWMDEFTSQNTLSKEFLALCGLSRMVRLNQRVGGDQRVGSWDRRSWDQIFMRQKVFLKQNNALPHPQWQEDVENYNWYVPLNTPKKNKTQRSKKTHE